MKKISLIISLVFVLIMATSCVEMAQVRNGNRITYGVDVQTFNYAYVYCNGNKIAEGHVSQWRDYDNSDTVQVMINGKYYLTFYSNVVLVSDPEIG